MMLMRHILFLAVTCNVVCAIPGKRHLHLQTMMNGLKAEIKAEGKVTPYVQKVFDELVDVHIPRLYDAIECGFNATQTKFHQIVDLLQAWTQDTNFTKRVADVRTDWEFQCNQEVHPLQCDAVHCRITEDFEVQRCCDLGRECGFCPCEPIGNQNRTWTYSSDIFGDKICDMFEAPQCEQCTNIHDLKNELVRVGEFLFEFYANFSLQQKNCIIYTQNVTSISQRCTSAVMEFDDKVEECNDLTADANVARCRFGSWLQEKCLVYQKWLELNASSWERLGSSYSEVDRHYEWDTVNTIECFIRSYSNVTLNFTDFDPNCINLYNATYHLDRREHDVAAALSLQSYPFQDCEVLLHSFGDVSFNQSVLVPDLILPPPRPECTVQTGLGKDCPSPTQGPLPECPEVEFTDWPYDWHKEYLGGANIPPYDICRASSFSARYFTGPDRSPCHPTQHVETFDDCAAAGSDLNLGSPREIQSDDSFTGCYYDGHELIFNKMLTGAQQNIQVHHVAVCAFRQGKRWAEYLDAQTCDPEVNWDFSSSFKGASGQGFWISNIIKNESFRINASHSIDLEVATTRTNIFTGVVNEDMVKAEILNDHLLKIPVQSDEVTKLRFQIFNGNIPFWTLTFMDFDTVTDTSGAKLNERIRANLEVDGHPNFEQARNGLKVHLQKFGDAPTGHWTFETLQDGSSVAEAADPTDVWTLSEDQKDRTVAFKGTIQSFGDLLTVEVDLPKANGGHPSGPPVTGYLLVSAQTTYQCVPGMIGGYGL